MLPDARNPLHHAAAPRTALLAARGAPGSARLGVGEAAAEVAGEEAVDGLHVVGAEHPAEVVVQLEVRRRARRHRLVHRPDYVRTNTAHTDIIIDVIIANGKIRVKYENVGYTLIGCIAGTAGNAGFCYRRCSVLQLS